MAIYRNLLACSILFIFSILLTACGTLSPSGEATGVSSTTIQDASLTRWWYVRFYKVWPKDTKAPFYYDPLLAEQVVAPVLASHRQQITLWRFHRRAVRDKGGSVFSFIFYSDAATAEKVMHDIRHSRILKDMLQENLLARVHYDGLNKRKYLAIDATSDKHWPGEIQDTWPYYIMGVSESWLALVKQISAETGVDEANGSIPDLVEKYRDVSGKINKLWLKNGRHAYFHHLNALFGYAPLEVRF